MSSEATTVLLKKRERTQNWIPEEKNALFSLIKIYVNAIENKKIDAAASAMKSQAWNQIYSAFRGRFSAARDITRIREQWRRMKAQARMEMYTYSEKVRRVQTSSSYIIASSNVLERTETSRVDWISFVFLLCAGADLGPGSGCQVPAIGSLDRGMAIDGERAEDRGRPLGRQQPGERESDDGSGGDERDLGATDVAGRNVGDIG